MCSTCIAGDAANYSASSVTVRMPAAHSSWPQVITDLLTIQDVPLYTRPYAGGQCTHLPRQEATNRMSMAWNRSPYDTIALVRAEADRSTRRGGAIPRSVLSHPTAVARS
jgi:hypothetical protein